MVRVRARQVSAEALGEFGAAFLAGPFGAHTAQVSGVHRTLNDGVLEPALAHITESKAGMNPVGLAIPLEFIEVLVNLFESALPTTEARFAFDVVSQLATSSFPPNRPFFSSRR